MSLNIVGTHLADHTEDIDRADKLRERLTTDNKRWESVCKSAAAWQTKLQTALMEVSGIDGATVRDDHFWCF